MPDRHVMREHYRALARGELTTDQINRRYRGHARALCPTCRAEHLAFLQEINQPRKSSELAILRMLLGHLVDELRRLDQKAEEELRALEGLSFEQQRALVERARTRFRNPFLADRLIRASREAVYNEPQRARELAELAFEVALRGKLLVLDGDPSFELLALAAAHRANALRAAGDLRAAEEAMSRALHPLDELSELVRAEICSLAASLRRAQRRYDEAMDLIDRAVQLYRTLGEEHLAGRNLLIRSQILHQQGEIDPAIATHREALSLLDHREDLRLYLWAQHDLTCYLADAGAYREARKLLDDNRSLYESYPDEPTVLRRRWVEAKVARGLGESSEAEAAFLEARDGFARREHGYDAALVSLELTLLYLDHGRTGEVQELARAMVPIFRAQDVHREALAALVVFVEAASREAVSRELVEHLADYLRQARNDPSLRFEPPSSLAALD